MSEVLPIRSLTDEDSLIFGSLNVSLGNLQRASLAVSEGIVITAPQFKLKTILERWDLISKEVFEQSLSLVKKEINSIEIPQILNIEIRKHKHFFLNGEIIKSQKELWQKLLNTWLLQIKNRLWQEGFSKGLTEGLESQVVIFVKKIKSFGRAYFDPLSDDVVINIQMGKLHPNDLKKIVELVKAANKKLFIPHEYEWVLEDSIKFSKVLPFTPLPIVVSAKSIDLNTQGSTADEVKEARSTVKVFFDLSLGFTIEKNVDGIFIASEKIFDLNKPRDSFENLVFKLVESAISFPSVPILFKLADKSEGMGKIRGALRLIHQQSLLTPLLDALDFARHKKKLANIHIVIPFVRSVSELIQVKRELSLRKLMRKSSLKQWLEIAIPENILNLEDYLLAGLDGVILNLDELISHFSGFDLEYEELTFYKKEVSGLLKFLGDALKILHKVKIPFVAFGSLSLNPQVLEFLVEKGVYGIVVEKYEVPSVREVLYQTEKRLVLKRSS